MAEVYESQVSCTIRLLHVSLGEGAPPPHCRVEASQERHGIKKGYSLIMLSIDVYW